MLYVGIDSWIIQDGNYGEFRVGEHAKFALEFCPQTLEAASSRLASLERIRACHYRIRGQLVYLHRSVCVIDFGWMAYREQRPPSHFHQGAWVEGECYLGIDPFFYSERLHALPGMPALQYNWRIAAIHLETTPWLSQKDDSGATLLSRDERQQSFVEVAETNAWVDDQGRAHYVLACDRTTCAS